MKGWLAVSVSAQGTRSPVATSRLAECAREVLRAEKARAAMISVTLVSNARIAALNWRHLRHRGPTDVLAFALARAPRGPVMGDIYVAPAVARSNAVRLGLGVREELVRLVVHGVLHVLGHDHPAGTAREASAMWRRQERLVGRLRKAGVA